MRRKSVVRLGLVPALGLSVGLTAPETLGQVLEEVLVTARKREENLQEVAVAVSVVTAQTIEDAGLVRLTDISQLVPNMTYQENISNKFTNITLRGISSSGGLGNDPGVGVYVDEVYVARESGFNADLLDIERVEVLKGPQGTLFGRNTAVGAINIATKKPADEFTGMVLADVGDYLHRIKLAEPRFTGRAIKNITDAIKMRAMDIELPDDWFEKPETFMHKSYDDKKAMIEELRGPFSMAMVMQEINRYADSEFRYSDRSDDADVNRMIRDTRLRERAIREIEEMKAKGHWNA